jgi:hypothetical protein
LDQAGVGHALAQAAFLEKVLFKTADLLVEQVVCQLNKTDDGVGADGRIAVFDGLTEGLVASAGRAIELTQARGVRVIAGPLFKVADAQEVPVVGEEFFEAGAGDVGQFDFHFFGSSRGHAALDDVLFA